LIAQESSFNPRTVSWAKAMGLTQVTPIAEDEVSSQIPDYDSWPKYKGGTGRLPASVIKMMVLSGRINDKNDWKLDRELSIRGGLAYLSFLQKLWSTPAMMARFDDIERTKLVLASYNSGRVRVLSAVHRYGKAWLRAPQLREARLYVNRIFSFCDSFSQEQKQDPTDQMTQLEVDDEDQT
jgi:soluble lytic murein transglycosylase-like protein